MFLAILPFALVCTFWPNDSCIVIPIINMDFDIYFLVRARHPRKEKKSNAATHGRSL